MPAAEQRAGRRRQSLLLIGHGSQRSPDSSAPVYAHAARIRARRIFDDVREAFWKEEPPLRDALRLVGGDDVFVVPIFLAEGYFTRHVIPREMRLDGPVTRDGSRLVRYCRPIGTHPRMDEMVRRRAVQAARLSPDGLKDAALVVLGHGTERAPTSGHLARHVTTRLRETRLFCAVECGFLDQEPGIEQVLARIDAPHTIIVPFFAAEGWHTRTTIPRRLGLTGARTERDGRVLWYTPPVGTLADVAEIAVELARDAGARVDDPVRAP